MWKGSSFQRLLALLRPEVLPHVGRLVAVALLAPGAVKGKGATRQVRCLLIS